MVPVSRGGAHTASERNSSVPVVQCQEVQQDIA
jgi:hypothetical protein